jgi:asparagine synthase (glutamine-hydrolysing)
MCGILGLFQPSGLPTGRQAFANGLARIKRRGPDSEGQWNDAQIWLGHRRLAILDLSPTGYQPMVSDDGRYVIVFNGEIYNHLDVREMLAKSTEWRGTSDTETLLEAYKAWGPSCLERLNGMFAFAIWDSVESTVFLARDRIGVKPLYYGWINGRLVFGSRPTAVATLLEPSDREFNMQSLRAYLELGFIPAPLSMYRALQKLEPAHYLVCDSRGVRLQRYWQYEAIESDRQLRPDDELADELQELIRRAVHTRLISDVPLGAFLSSGVDSAMVVAAMRDTGSAATRAYSISFNDPRFDEGPGAARIADYLGIELLSERVNVDDLLLLLPDYVREADEPLADSSSIATMAVARLARREVTVALTGDGGDELFCGYPHYRRYAYICRTLGWPVALRQILGSAIGAMPRHNAKLLAGALAAPDEVHLFHYLRSMIKDFPALMPVAAMTGTHSSEQEFEKTAATFPRMLRAEERAMRLDIAYTLPDLYLQKVDVATMAFSLEARCPLTDFRLVEWAMRLPMAYKLREGRSKYLLKKVLCRSLPAHFVNQPKRGFSIPIGPWLSGPLKAWAQERLNDKELANKLPIDTQRLLGIFDLQASGKRNSYPIVWAVLMLFAFVSEHSDLGPSPSMH